MREIVKVRTVAGSVVVSLPASILEPVGIKPGDRVLVEAAPPRRLIITKEGKTMTSTERLELEISLLEKKKQAIDSNRKYKLEQYNENFFTEEGMSADVFPLVMRELNRDEDQLDVEIAEKKLALYDLQGAVEDAAQRKETLMSKPEFVVSYAVGDDRSFTVNMPPERIAKGGYVRCQAKGCNQIIPIKEGAGTCTCGAKFEIYPALLDPDEDA